MISGDEDDHAEQEAQGEGAEHVGRHRTGDRRRDVQDRLAQPGVHVHQGTPAQDGRLQEHEQGEEGDGGEGDDGREDGLAQVGPDRQGRLAQVVGRLLELGGVLDPVEPPEPLEGVGQPAVTPLDLVDHGGKAFGKTLVACGAVSGLTNSFNIILPHPESFPYSI